MSDTFDPLSARPGSLGEPVPAQPLMAFVPSKMSDPLNLFWNAEDESTLRLAFAPTAVRVTSEVVRRRVFSFIGLG